MRDRPATLCQDSGLNSVGRANPARVTATHRHQTAAILTLGRSRGNQTTNVLHPPTDPLRQHVMLSSTCPPETEARPLEANP